MSASRRKAHFELWVIGRASSGQLYLIKGRGTRVLIPQELRSPVTTLLRRRRIAIHRSPNLISHLLSCVCVPSELEENHVLNRQMGRKKPTAREEEALAVGGRSKKKNIVIDDDEYSIGSELVVETQVDEEKVVPAVGKKKSKKGNSRGTKPKDDDGEEDDDKNLIEREGEEVPEIELAGKRKPKSRRGLNNMVARSSFELLEDENDEKSGSVQSEEDEPVVSFTGRKKSSKVLGNSDSLFSVVAIGDDEEEEGIDSAVTEQNSMEDGNKSENDNEAMAVSFTGKKKKSKSNKKNAEPENVFPAINFDAVGEGKDIRDEKKDEDEDVGAVAFTGKKKSSKSSKRSGNMFSTALLDEENWEDDLIPEPQSVPKSRDVTVEDEDEGAGNIAFTGKKSSKFSKKNGNMFSAALLDEKNGETETMYEPQAVPKSKDDIADDLSIQDQDEPVITFAGKKKSSRKKKDTVFASLSEEAVDEVETKDSNSMPNNIELDHFTVQNKDSEEVAATSGNKKKKKKSGRTAQEEDDLDKILAELGEGAPASKPTPFPLVLTEEDAVDAQPEPTDLDEDTGDKEGEEEGVLESAAKKKKKKKGGRTVQEEKDLDMILAELGEGAPALPPQPPIKEEKVGLQPEPAGLDESTGAREGEEEGVVESAAAKKKKKKKEKEKEKKAAAAAISREDVEEKQEEPKNEMKSRGADKKLPKHVREMQEALARRKEAEERKKREEEERLRKEEEERRRQEELEKQAEEAKLRKKEREKEKLLKKRQEGRLLTGKQKEEQRRLEAMRNQFLASKGISLPAVDNGAPSKRPIYSTKKSKAHHAQTNAFEPTKDENVEEEENKQVASADVDSLEMEKIEEGDDTEGVVEKAEDTSEIKENGFEEEDQEEEDDEDWDAKSWDDANLALPVKSAFDDEEAESEPAPVHKKDIKRTAQPAASVVAPSAAVLEPDSVAKKTTSPNLSKTEATENKQSHYVVAATDKNMRKDADFNKTASSSNSQPKQSEAELRSPICCIMGHVDTGKTKLLDCIRGTNVQEGEAGGITQQIGATYFPAENIRERTKELKADAKLKVPGLLVIDTPGHESFSNLRSRGSGLCDIAILVVDIMHGLEPQTIESLNLLKMRNTEFIVALNKVDRLYGWKTCRNAPIIKAMKQQSKDVQNEFNMRLTQIVTQFKEQGLNTELYYRNKEMGETFSIVPTSAISGEGIPDLLLLLVQWTQKTMVEKLTFSDEVQCTVLEVKMVEGHGMTIDVVLVNGVLHEGDQIVVCGMEGPIVTTIRALLTPHPMKELRVKGTYLHHKEIKAAQGIKITAQGLDHAIAGSDIFVVGPDDDLERIKELAMEDMQSVLSRINRSGEGVYVQASTLGSLEALLEFLKSPAVNIPVSGISIGPVSQKDVKKASVMLEKKKEYATILAFDVKVTPDVRDYAVEVGVKLFNADIIYHLFDQFKAYIDNLKEEKKKEAADEVVFPCVLKILPNCIFNKKDPIVLGVDVLEGIAKVGTPICIPSREFIDIGRISSIENNHKPVDFARKGQKVAIKIVGSNPEEQQKMYGRHFELDDELVSHISRRSIDILKANYREDLTLDEWKLVFLPVRDAPEEQQKSVVDMLSLIMGFAATLKDIHGWQLKLMRCTQDNPIFKEPAVSWKIEYPLQDPARYLFSRANEISPLQKEFDDTSQWRRKILEFVLIIHMILLQRTSNA
ncbi:hypothetical protein Nepgr_014469 [Nepenthes gracilis]|uniref:Eukaryotic translation initiation factor 5B n=1 Tax=Nepenthes gracilis TaxID=150966 RepID=A0AAD3XPV9_NEPGR|nr:hypothetical protein Nepgr_014469 [Nepenthes gracilis]